MFEGGRVAPIYNSVMAVRFRPANRNMVISIYRQGGRVVHPPLTGLSRLIFVASAYRPTPGLLLLSGFLTMTLFGNVAPVVIFAGASGTPTSRCMEVCSSLFAAFYISGSANRKDRRIETLLASGFSTFANGSNTNGSALLGGVYPSLGLTAGRVDEGLNENGRAAHEISVCPLPSNNCITSAPNFSAFGADVCSIVVGSRLTSYFPRFRRRLKGYECRSYSRAGRRKYTILRTLHGKGVRGAHRGDCYRVCTRTSLVGP